MSSLYLTSVAVAQETNTKPGDELSFFDYLGALVEDGEGWVDPLVLLEQDETLGLEPAAEVGREPTVAKPREASTEQEVAQ